MRSTSLSFGLLLVVSTAGAAEPPSQSAYVLVRNGAELFQTPEIRATTLERAGDGPYLFRLVEARGDWLVVESTEPSGQPCATELGGLKGLRVPFLVRRSDLAEVTTRTVRLKWEDGTSIELLPGVPLTRIDARTHRARADGLEVDLQLPEDAVGTAFVPTRGFTRTIGHEVAAGSQDAPTLFVNGNQPVRPVWRTDALNLRTERNEGSGPKRLITFATECVRLRVVTDSSNIARAQGLRGGVIGCCTAHRRTVREGTALFWPDGTAAGAVVRDTQLDDISPGNTGRVCFNAPVSSPCGPLESDPTIVLCADEKDVIERRR